MNHKCILQTIRRALRRRGGVSLAALPEQIRRHAETGEQPTGPLAQRFITLTESALAAMNASVGGDGHQAACEAYSKALGGWNTALKESGV